MTTIEGSDDNRPAVKLLTIDAEIAGQRIDNFLITKLKGVPKTHIYRLLRKGEIRVNKGRIKADYRLAEGDLVRIAPIRMGEPNNPIQASAGLIKALDSAILYEDDGILVVNKPSGLAVHGGSGVSLGLIEALRQVRPESKHLELVHRLDKETSGCILVAKKRSTLKALHEALRQGQMDKVYLALVVGQWPSNKKEINAPLLKNVLQSGERMVNVNPEGKASKTLFKVVQRFSDVTLVEAKPITGRTHQIRVHAKYGGHPIVGDEKYGYDDVNKRMKSLGVPRLFLHAAHLTFVATNGEKVTVNAPLDDVLTRALAALS
jgi:23S rRNA pseudouridine955/2504/2580 synthase